MKALLDSKEPQLSCYSFDKTNVCYKKCKQAQHIDTLVCTSEFIKIVRYLNEKNLDFSEDGHGNILVKDDVAS